MQADCFRKVAERNTHATIFSCLKVNFVCADAEAANAEKIWRRRKYIRSDTCVTSVNVTVSNARKSKLRGLESMPEVSRNWSTKSKETGAKNEITIV